MKRRNNSHRNVFRSQSGSALVSVMAISSAILILMTLYAKRHELVQKISKGKEFHIARNELAKNILTHISNPEFLKASAKRTLLSPANEMFKKCLEVVPETDEDCIPVIINEQEPELTSQGYYRSNQINSLTGKRDELYRLVLIPPAGSATIGDNRWLFQYPGKRDGRSDELGNKINCPPQGRDHISCVLAGAPEDNSFEFRRKNQVGYNFRGESGELGPCYPLEAVVYMNPLCPLDEFGVRKANCTFAEDFGFAAQIIHRDKEYFGGEICDIQSQVPPHSLGTYPKQLDFIYQPRHLLAGFECNFGAFTKGYTDNGNIQCECRFPYQPTGKQNERGVLCEKFENECPDGSMFTGRKKDGSPVCKFLNELSEGIPTNQIIMGTKTADGTTPGDSIECPDKGWLQELNMACGGTVTTTKTPVKDDICSEGWFVMNLIRGNVHFFKHGQFLYIDDEPWGKGCSNIRTKVYLTAYIDKIIRAAEGSVVHIICLAVRLGVCTAAAVAAAFFGGPAAYAAAFIFCVGVALIPWVDYEFDCYAILNEPAISCSLQGKCFKFDSNFLKEFD